MSEEFRAILILIVLLLTVGLPILGAVSILARSIEIAIIRRIDERDDDE